MLSPARQIHLFSHGKRTAGSGQPRPLSPRHFERSEAESRNLPSPCSPSLKPLNPHTEGMLKGEAATTTSELSEPGPQSGPYSRPLPTRCARHPPPERGWAGKKEERDVLFKICGVSRHHNPRPERPSNLRTLRSSGRSILRTFSIPVDTILRG